jgi:hypothetical protein
MDTSALIALCFLTCDRTDYTIKTLDTLTEFNDLSQFILLHGDDGSTDPVGPRYAREKGFETVVQTKRIGVSRATERLIAEAARCNADVVINLQNDWSCHRAIPLADLKTIFEDDVYCVRLYGEFKSWTGRCGQHHAGREPRQLVNWKPYRPGYEIGEIHWGHPPAATRTDFAVQLTKGAASERDSRLRSGVLTKKTVRVVENVFRHFGRERTPGFRL